LARWLRNPAGSARDYNEDDLLVHEVFFAVHDYLYVWTAQPLRELVPEQRLGGHRSQSGITKDWPSCSS